VIGPSNPIVATHVPLVPLELAAALVLALVVLLLLLLLPQPAMNAPAAISAVMVRTFTTETSSSGIYRCHGACTGGIPA
jgi:hypothetical protein